MSHHLSDSLWHQSCAETVSTGPLQGAQKADLVVIGGGYTGLSAALHGALDGADVCLVEAGTIGEGGSGRNAGLANAGLWLPPEDINARIGDIAGTRLTQLLGAAPDMVFGLIERFSMKCAPVRKGTLHCAHAPDGLDDLNRRHAQLTAIGAPVEILSRDDAVARTGSEAVHGALFDPRAGTIQPLGYARGLARAALDAGARLFDTSPAISVEKNGEAWTVTTPGGSVTARHLIVATNGYHLPIAGLETPKTVTVHYFQGATKPLSVEQLATILPGGEGCWDTALVMSSWRRDEAGRVILGAMGTLGALTGWVHRGWMTRKLAGLYPELSKTPLEQMWHGRIAMTAEYLPKILRIDASALAAFGYSGRGIGPATVFGAGMAKALLSGEDTHLPLPVVEQHALPRAGLRGAYYEFGATVTHLVKDRL